MKDNTCICCGQSIPEGRQICPECDQGSRKGSFSFAENGGMEEYEQSRED